MHWIGLFLSVVVLVAGFGCSKNVGNKGSRSIETWTCDEQADRAMKREDYETGILLHQRFLENEPKNGLALYHLGYAYGQTGEHAKEVFHYEKAIELGFVEADDIFFNLGMGYLELNEIEKSVQAFKKALDIDAGSADNHFGLAVALQINSDDNLAEAAFLRAINIDPRHLEARLHLSMLYVDLGQRQKALEQLRKILEIDPTHSMARQFLKNIESEY